MVLHGSPRKNGNSNTLTEYFIKGVREIRDAELKHFYINDLNIRESITKIYLGKDKKKGGVRFNQTFFGCYYG